MEVMTWLGLLYGTGIDMHKNCFCPELYWLPVMQLYWSTSGVSNLFDRRAKCTNLKLVRGQIEMPKASREQGMGRGVPLPSQLEGLGEHRKLPQWGPGRKRVLAYFRAWKNTPYRHKSIIFFSFLAGQVETPGGPDCGPQAVCWTLLIYM